MRRLTGILVILCMAGNLTWRKNRGVRGIAIVNENLEGIIRSV